VAKRSRGNLVIWTSGNCVPAGACICWVYGIGYLDGGCVAARWRVGLTEFIAPATLPITTSNPTATRHFDGVERLRNLSFDPFSGTRKVFRRDFRLKNTKHASTQSPFIILLS